MIDAYIALALALEENLSSTSIMLLDWDGVSWAREKSIASKYHKIGSYTSSVPAPDLADSFTVLSSLRKLVRMTLIFFLASSFEAFLNLSLYFFNSRW